MTNDERCTCGETACESELCECDSIPCPVDHAEQDEISRLQGRNARLRAALIGSVTADMKRLRNMVLSDVWVRLRDAEDGPHLAAMSVVIKMTEES